MCHTERSRGTALFQDQKRGLGRQILNTLRKRGWARMERSRRCSSPSTLGQAPGRSHWQRPAGLGGRGRCREPRAAEGSAAARRREAAGGKAAEGDPPAAEGPAAAERPPPAGAASLRRCHSAAAARPRSARPALGLRGRPVACCACAEHGFDQAECGSVQCTDSRMRAACLRSGARQPATGRCVPAMSAAMPTVASQVWQ